jgi:cytochrome c oxidase accessory protein FixG
MPATALLPEPAAGRVLPTLNHDGTRRWLRPTLSRGRFFRRRRGLAWVLIALFALIPYLRMNGKPLILLDVVRRQFTLFGTTFLPTDTGLLMLLLVGIFLAIFWLTAVYGRVWCGWACPQTVYMEFLYRPIERLIEGGPRAQSDLDRRGWALRRLVKHAVFVGLSVFLAHTFLAYFVGVEELRRWVTRSPFEHPAAFLVMATTTALMFLDFGWFREQVCMVACPYGRLQSVLLDRRSLIVGYDAQRGEPRGTYGQRKTAGVEPPWTRAGDSPGTVAFGDCIDCGACVVTCPTGIDIRQGLQMECIHCTQCMDACDAVMDRIGRPPGLIRYSSKDQFQGEPRRILRPRVVVYPLLVLLVWGALGVALAHRDPAEITVLRGLGSPFTLLPSGEVSNQLRVKIVNRGSEERHYRIQVAEDAIFRLVAPDNPLPVGGGRSATATVFVIAPRSAFVHGQRDIRLHVDDEAGFGAATQYRLMGPSE